MSAPGIILDCLPSLCQKLSDLVEVWRGYNQNNFACFLLRHGVYIVWVQKFPLRFSDNFPKWLGIFNQFFTHLLYVRFYTRLQIFIQLFPTLTKLCHFMVATFGHQSSGILPSYLAFHSEPNMRHDVDIQHLWRQRVLGCWTRTIEQSSIAPERCWVIIQ